MQDQNIGLALHTAMMKCRKSFVTSCENLADARRSLTGAIRATIAVAHGIPSGRIEDVEGFTQSQLDLAANWFCQWFGANTEWNAGAKTDFDRTVRNSIARVMKGRANVDVSATFRFAEMRQAAPCTIRYRHPDDPLRMVGLDITLRSVITKNDEFEEAGVDGAVDSSTVDSSTVEPVDSSTDSTLPREDGSQSGLTVETVKAMAQFTERARADRRVGRIRAVHARSQMELAATRAALEAARLRIAALEAALEESRAREARPARPARGRA